MFRLFSESHLQAVTQKVFYIQLRASQKICLYIFCIYSIKSRLLHIYASAWSGWTTTCVTPDSSVNEYVINIDAGFSVQVHRSVDPSIIEEVKCIWLSNPGSIITETKLYSTLINLSTESILRSLKHMLTIQISS